MISKSDILDSEYNMAGRIGLVFFVLGIMMAIFLICCPLNTGKSEINIGTFFLASQLMAFMAFIAIAVLWGVVAFFIAFAIWVINGCGFDYLEDIFMFPVKIGKFLIKFIFGDWNRLLLFKKGE